MESLEQPIVIKCADCDLPGILHRIEGDAPSVIIINVVGGPQYRVGSHRQFVITARDCASQDICFLRYDYRGMGDAPGEPRTFENIEVDICAAVNWAKSNYPEAKVVLMGLCDGASAIAKLDKSASIDGLIMINPWVHSEQLEAVVHLKHYYWRRLASLDFWINLVSANSNFFNSIGSFIKSVRSANITNENTDEFFVSAMAKGLVNFQKPILLMLSQQDLTAKEFENLCATESAWRDLTCSPNWEAKAYSMADHTLSKRVDLDRANKDIVTWVQRHFSEPHVNY